MTKASTWEFWEGHQHFSYIYLYTYTHSQTHTECQNIGNGHHWSYNLKVNNRFLPLVLYLFLPSKCSVVYFCYLCYFIDIYISSEPSRKPQNTGVGSPSILQGIFLTQDSNQGLLQCRWMDASSIPGSGRSLGEGTGYPSQYSWVSLVAQMVKNLSAILPAIWETWVQFLGWEDPLEEGMVTHSSILAWKIPWRQEPGGLQSMGLQRVGHN